MTFTPPTVEQVFALQVNAGIDHLAQAETFAAATPDMVEAILTGIGAFAANEWAPLNTIGDRLGAQVEDGKVTLPDGFGDAYRAYVGAGWNSLSGPAEFGGQGLPFAVGVAGMESLGAANLAFSLCPMLTLGAVEALRHHGSDEQQRLYLPKLVSGEWTGTMNLTEPQAGSDVGALRTTATPIETGEHAGKYLIAGTKIFITWGGHDVADNIVHLVLARTPGAPEGSRGISLFLVPRYRVAADGSLGDENDVRVVSLEHKLGINASPTCVMSYGDNGACVGELVGAENQGLRAMFTMMNHARLNVGAQGTQIAERATQQAMGYAVDRVQSARAGSSDTAPVSIAEHPDVRRMLLRMRALTEASRALLYFACGQVDRGSLGDAAAKARADVLVPLVKAWNTDIGVEVASLGVQVHGGMGFVEETGAAQHYRDARIAPIYEGTNGIQAADFVTRKINMDAGETLRALLEDARTAADAGGAPGLTELCGTCLSLLDWTLADASVDDRLGGSVPYATMCAVAIAGWQMLRQKDAANDGDAGDSFNARKRVVVDTFLSTLVPEATGMAASVRAGGALLYALDTRALTQ